MFHLQSAAGLTAEINRNGSLRRLLHADLAINLFVGAEVEGGPANLWLRRYGGARTEALPLLGPASPTRFGQAAPGVLAGEGEWGDLRYVVNLALADQALAWVWRIEVQNRGAACDIDVVYAQDLALSSYGAVRINEYYVSQYVDHTPLAHAQHGWVLASRQNQPVGARHPWSIIGSLRRAASYATDALQVFGLAARVESAPAPRDCPGRRLQHEHSMAVLQDERRRLDTAARLEFGFAGLLLPDHPYATTQADLAHFDALCASPEAQAPLMRAAEATPAVASLFARAKYLEARDLEPGEVDAVFGLDRRHEEREDGRLLSFFLDGERHVVLRAKELRVQRPHGALLRTGAALTPDESAMTSTAWMSGVFHSMVTQGHVSINRILSTVRTYLGLFRAQGQRVFVEMDGEWRLLGAPSAFEMSPRAACWFYRHDHGLIEVRTSAHESEPELTLEISVLEGAPARFLVANHVALNGDDGALESQAAWRRDGGDVAIFPAAGSEMQARFPEGSLLFTPTQGSFEQVGGDELLFDGVSHAQPYVCFITAAALDFSLTMRGRLIAATAPAPAPPAHPFALQLRAPKMSAAAEAVACMADIAPWFVDNALVHYLAPRGLEQYTGGGWGTRDVSQGPVELLLAFGRTAPVRDLLLRVMRAQCSDGDWPQWFMFFERDRRIRAGDSHGDIVFWPLLALAQYLLASGDAGVLDAREPFYSDNGAGEAASVWEHVQRSLSLIQSRLVAGTALAAYGHGDWNDSLQPANPAMREHMCSAWTVTLHYQTLTTLAQALRSIGRERDAAPLEQAAQRVARDFQRVLIVDGVLTGYALFENDGARYLLHPRDDLSGVKYSSLAMIHALLEGLFTPEQARAHMRLIEQELSGPDGVRLFDRPMPYHGGVRRLFQRAETASFFGREIGLMYMHAHLRYAQALAHLGEAEKFFRALRQAIPIGMRELTPQASLRQANCYYSSSDAAFADRYEASREYGRMKRGEVALDGGWRVYSSGAGIAMSLLVRKFLGVTQQHERLSLDPVMPASLNGLHAQLAIYGRPVELKYEVGPRGFGVTEAVLNGRALSFTAAPNPYRAGAAQIARSSVESLLEETGNELLIRLGQGT